MGTAELILQTVLAVVECIRDKKASRKVRRLRQDVQRFLEAAAEGDEETVTRMLYEAGRGDT